MIAVSAFAHLSDRPVDVVDAAPLDLAAVARGFVPLRVSLLHKPVARGGAGPLASFVRERRALALDLMLLAHAVWPLATSGSIVASSSEWATALGIGNRPGSRSAISRSWTWLETHRLVASRSMGQRRGIAIRCEDGSGRQWRHPAEHNEPYFHLPHAYWTTGFATTLSLSGKALLLIGLSLQGRGEPYFELPVERGAVWYGLAPRSVRAGLRDLRAAGLLRTWVERRQTDRSPVGHAFDRRHNLIDLEYAVSRRHRDPDQP